MGSLVAVSMDSRRAGAVGSAPMARHLFIVARDQPDLWAHLAREFRGEAGVEVLLDRRRIERRRSATPAVEDRRRRDRRERPPVDQDLAAMNFALVAAD